MTQREMFSLRLGPSTMRWIEDRAVEYGVSKAQVVRAVFAVALGDELPKNRVIARLAALGQAQDLVD